MKHNFQIEPVTGTNLIKIYPRDNENLPIKINPNERYFTVYPWFEEFIEEIQNFEVRSDDVWVITQPKSGTTWMLELVWLLKHNLDFETALDIEQEERTPILESCTILPQERPNSLDEITNMQSPRILKTHLAMHLLPKQLWTVKPKIIYVARDPKDAIVSLYYYHTSIGMFKGSKDEFVTSMINNKLRHTPFGVQAIDFWKLRNLPYVFFTSFERMKKDLRSVILKLSEFLQEDISEKQMVKLLDHLSFENMKNNDKCNHVNESKVYLNYFGDETTPINSRFVRKGEINSYKTELSEEIREELENWNKNQMETNGITSEDLFLS